MSDDRQRQCRPRRRPRAGSPLRRHPSVATVTDDNCRRRTPAHRPREPHAPHPAPTRPRWRPAPDPRPRHATGARRTAGRATHGHWHCCLRMQNPAHHFTGALHRTGRQEVQAHTVTLHFTHGGHAHAMPPQLGHGVPAQRVAGYRADHLHIVAEACQRDRYVGLGAPREPAAAASAAAVHDRVRPGAAATHRNKRRGSSVSHSGVVQPSMRRSMASAMRR